MEECIINTIKDVLETEVEITMNTVMEDVPEWDSFGQVALLDSLQKEFGIHFSFDEIVEMNSVKKIFEIVYRYI